MNKLITLILILSLGIFSCKDEPAAVKYKSNTYQIDNYKAGDDAIFQSGFTIGEYAAVVLGPINETFILNEVQFLFGGELDEKDVMVRVYWDEGTLKPGAQMYEGKHKLKPSVTDLQKINLRDKNITFHGGGSFRVAVEFLHDGLPCIARDDDGQFTQDKNLIQATGSWTFSKNKGLSDDFVIRAVVDTKE